MPNNVTFKRCLVGQVCKGECPMTLQQSWVFASSTSNKGVTGMSCVGQLKHQNTGRGWCVSILLTFVYVYILLFSKILLTPPLTSMNL